MDIIIVDDSKTQEVFLARVLRGQNYEVRAASNGADALRLLEEKAPDLLITDIIMPGMTGFELCAKIKSDPRFQEIPVILLTVLSDPEDIIQALQCNADAFITKPYEDAFLLAQVQNVLSNRELHRDPARDAADFVFAGRNHRIQSRPDRMLSLLLATYENAMQKNRELNVAIEELRRAKLQLENQNRELGRLNEQKNQFLGMAAHDLRNPLGVIKGFSEILAENEAALGPGEKKQVLDRIKGSSEFMLQLVDDLLDLSAIESGKIELRRTPVPPAKLIEDCVMFNRIPAEKKDIRVLTELANDLPPLMVDAGKVEQILNNLVTNAIKFSYPGKAVLISAHRGTDGVHIVVRDQGQGMPPERLEQLFQPFARGSKGTAGEKSTGLGLSIVKKIVEAHGAQITVASTAGQGSEFTVIFPL